MSSSACMDSEDTEPVASVPASTKGETACCCSAVSNTRQLESKKERESNLTAAESTRTLPFSLEHVKNDTQDHGKKSQAS